MKQNIGKILAVVLVVALCTVFFAACVPATPEKAQAKLQDAGYTVDITTHDADSDGMVGELTATKGTLLNVEGYVVVTFFESAKQAKAYADAHEADMNNFVNMLKSNLDGEITWKVSGKTIYIGNEQGIKDLN